MELIRKAGNVELYSDGKRFIIKEINNQVESSVTCKDENQVIKELFYIIEDLQRKNHKTKSA
jgi:hypothetical protein